MNKRKRKKKQKHARWVRLRAYDVMGGDYNTWVAHRNPVVEIYCSHCRGLAPTIKGKEHELHVEKYTLLKKKCPNCGYRMDGRE